MDKKQNVKVYMFPYKFLYVGWVTVTDSFTMFYADNEPYAMIPIEPYIRYLTIGFNKKKVMKRLAKWATLHKLIAL